MLKRLVSILLISLVSASLCGYAVAAKRMAKKVKEGVEESRQAKANLDNPLDKVATAVKLVLANLNIELLSETTNPELIHIKGRYPDKRAVDIRIAELGGMQSEITIDCGLTSEGVSDAENILAAVEAAL